MARKLLVFCFALVALLGFSGTAMGECCTIDAVPAATLLLPYFEVAFEEPSGQGVTTFFSINNASDAPALVHVVLWTDLSLPTIDFDLFLTGYDLQQVNLWNVFNGGFLPVTADLIRDPADLISPHGANPAWDGTFPNCQISLPFGSPAIFGDLLDHIQEGHTGNLSPFWGACGGEQHGDRIARGYITADNSNQCSLQFPDDAGYWADGGAGLANNINQLWGDYYIVDAANGFAFADNLVHIEAHGNTQVGPFVNGDYTFYSRYVGATAIDNREPLASTFAARYITGGAFSGGTDYLVWRDGQLTVDDPFFIGGPFSCAAGPTQTLTWYPLSQTQIVAFNEQEDPVELCAGGGQISPPPPGTTCFPLEAQRVGVGDGALNPPFNFGWMYLNLNNPLAVGPFGNLTQNWVTTNMSALGLYTVGYPAVVLNWVIEDVDPVIIFN